MSAPLCQAPVPELPQLLLGLARIGYGETTAQALSSLVAHAQEYGVEAVLGWVRADPGLLFVPSWQFWLPGSLTNQTTTQHERDKGENYGERQ